MSADIYQLARIPVIRRPQGYYLRWWYNGWHYWQFFAGSLTMATTGHKYATRGTRLVTMHSGQLTLEQVNALRTVLNSTEVYLYTSVGWQLIRVDAGTVRVFDNKFNGYELEFTASIGSRLISDTGFSPVMVVPIIPPDEVCELVIGDQIWACRNYDGRYPASRVYNDDEDNRSAYGGLYSGAQVMNAGFAPVGWRVPTEDDWDILIAYMGGLFAAGGYLKEAGLTHWATPNTGAADVYGFSARGGGWYAALYGYLGLREYAPLWTSTPYSSQLKFIQFSYNSEAISKSSASMDWFFGVRLIKDLPPPPTTFTATTSRVGLFELKMAGDGEVVIDWGDGDITVDVLTPKLFSTFTHVYAAGGTLTVTARAIQFINMQAQNVTSCVVPAECRQLEVLNLYNNQLTEFETHAEWVRMFGINLGLNNLSSFVVHNTWGYINDISVHGNAIIDDAIINAMLIAADETGAQVTPEIPMLQFDAAGGANAVPTGAGIDAADNLLAKGWSLYLNE